MEPEGRKADSTDGFLLAAAQGTAPDTQEQNHLCDCEMKPEGRKADSTDGFLLAAAPGAALQSTDTREYKELPYTPC